jgi:hypothetical protein
MYVMHREKKNKREGRIVATLPVVADGGSTINRCHLKKGPMSVGLFLY